MGKNKSYKFVPEGYFDLRNLSPEARKSYKFVPDNFQKL